MRVLVTGATGFIGGQVARELAAAGHDVVGTGRDARLGARLAESGVRFAPVDLRDWRRLAPLVDEADSVVHSAARSSLWGRWADFVADNIAPSVRIAARTAARGIRLVHVSSPSIYNATGVTRHVPEDLPVGPRFDSWYARSKWLGEQGVASAHPGALILRPRGVYGPGDRSIMPQITQALRAGRLPRLVRDEVWTELTHVTNVSRAVRLGLATDVAGPVNVTDGEATPLWATIDAVADAIGAARPSKRVPPRVLEGVAWGVQTACRAWPGRPEPPLTPSGVRLLTRAMSLDLTRARTELGLEPVVGAREAMAATVAHAAEAAR